MDDKVDMLFLEKDCPACGVIRAELDMNAATAVDFKGKDGQRLYVFSALSNDASLVLLRKFGLEGWNMPVLVTWDGEVRDSVQQVIAWMRKHGISTTK